MQKFKLKNGLTLIVEKRETDSVAIEVIVKIGSNYENKDNNGITHFIEHMLFNGTKNRTQREIGNEIESVGGLINGATSNERTFFSAIVPKKHFDNALDVLADIVQNPLFSKEKIEKERTIILDEINLLQTDPKFYQWTLFLKNLYEKHSTKNPGYGTKEIVTKLKREDLVSFYEKYFQPNNTVVVICGNVGNVRGKVEKAFSFKGKGLELEEVREPENKKKLIVEKRDIDNSYLLLGYKVAKRIDKESYVFDVIRSLSYRGLSGRLAEEIRDKRGLSYYFGALYDAGIDFGYFATFLSTNKENLEKGKDIILKVLKLENLTKQEVEEAKTYLEGNFLLRYENNSERADLIGSWAIMDKDVKDYLKNIRKVSKEDVLKAVKKYFKDDYTLAIIENTK